jgi:hypothetical protein
MPKRISACITIGIGIGGGTDPQSIENDENYAIDHAGTIAKARAGLH